MDWPPKSLPDLLCVVSLVVSCFVLRVVCHVHVAMLQAVIKLKRDGEFYVHNVGRATIFVNGRSVPTGKRMRLTHCCLVEVSSQLLLLLLLRSHHRLVKLTARTHV
jgi:hypothetical protein